jgi:hypothetical protein
MRVTWRLAYGADDSGQPEGVVDNADVCDHVTD